MNDEYNIVKSKVVSARQLDSFQDDYVYDIVMENKERQWFFANNILAHNSTYFTTGADTVEDAIEIGDRIGKEVNESFPSYMRETFFCTEGYDDIIATDREIIGSSGIFIGKKLYIIHIINDEGKKVDKLKSMGVSLKKTTLPKEFQVKLSSYIERLLKNESWDDISHDIVEYKKELSQVDNILRIGLPIGVKKVDKYTEDYEKEVEAKFIPDEIDDIETFQTFEKKEGSNDPYAARLPGHVAASLHWNKCLEQYDDVSSIKIRSGTKIKVYYLKKKFFNKFKSIAIPTDTTSIPEWFISEYKEFVDIDMQLQRLINNSLENILEAIGKEVPTAQNMIDDDLLDY